MTDAKPARRQVRVAGCGATGADEGALTVPSGLVVVGQSHVAAVWEASLRESRRSGPVARVELRRITCGPLDEALWEVTLRLASQAIDGVTRGPGIENIESDWRRDWQTHLERMTASAAQAGAAAVLWKGFQIDALALVLVGFPFDVLLDDGAADLRSTLVPRSAVEEALYEMLELDLYRDLLGSLSEVVSPGRLLVLGPPPPIAGTLARERLVEAEWFSTRSRLAGFADPSAVPMVEDRVRHKLWRVLLDVHATIGAEFGACFVPPPFSSFGEDGTLRPEYSGKDAHHANPDYGRLYLAEVLEALKRQA
jgi:hypothetical protein